MTGPVDRERDASQPRLLLPDAAADFERRASRLVTLSSDNPAGPFLELLARVARGQAAAARDVRVPAGATLLEGAPLDHRRWRIDGAWREMLQRVLSAVEAGPPLPPPAAATVARLRSSTAQELDALALPSLTEEPPDLAAAPFVAAALQAYYARLASGLARDVVAFRGAEASCPLCAAGPVAGVIAGDARVRHLACALCGARWHATRVQCVRCQSAAKLSYFAVEQLPGVDAETCDDCGVYVKLFDLEKRPGVEPVADDAATMVLDLLLAERGYRRTGPNLVAPAGLARQQRN